MKILFHSSDREHIQNILTGWENALVDSGYEVTTFRNQDIPVFRMFEIFKPDLFILEAVSVNKAIKKAVDQYGIKTVILTDRKLMAHQQIPNAKVVSYKELEGVLHLRLAIDYPQYKNPEKDDFYKCESALITNKKLTTYFDKADRIYSNIAQNSPFYAGKISNKKKIYTNTHGIYLNDGEEYTDIANMYYCGTHVWNMNDECAGNCTCADQSPPVSQRQSYHERMATLFNELGFPTEPINKKIEEIKNAEDWLTLR